MSTKAFLQELRELVEQTDLSQKPYYLLRLSGLMKRLEDPRMKLAIIGNFSCGKSTFLNALLRQPLLSMANTPTTAVPTWIDWESTEDVPQIWVKGLDNSNWEMNESGRKRLFRMTGIAPPGESGPLVDYLTTTTALLNHISKVRISFPTRQNLQGFTLIDTPGVNPGDEADAGHILSTQDVLRDEADAAIVLFPCYNAYTKDFSIFMEDNASHLMDDSIFILTKMDMVQNPKEQTQLVWFVRENLKKNFELKNPQVYACSAGMALEHYTGSAQESRIWADAFEEMTREIFVSLGDRRLHTAARRTSGLVLELMTDLTGAVEAQQKILEGFLNNLQTYSDKAFRDHVNALTLNYNAGISLRRLLASKASADQTLEDVSRELRRGIQEALTWRQLNGFLEKQARDMVIQTMRQVIDQSKAVADDYETAWKKAFDDLEEELYNSLHTYNSFLDSVPGNRCPDMALDLPDTLLRIRMDMDKAFANARKTLVKTQKEAEKLAKGSWLPISTNPVARMVVSLPDHRSYCLNTIDRTLNTLRDHFRMSASGAAQILFTEDTDSAKLLSQLYKQNYGEIFLLKQPDLDAYRSSLETQIQKQSMHLSKLKAMELELVRWTVKTESE